MNDHAEIRKYISGIIRRKIEDFADRQDLFNEVMLAISRKDFRGECNEKTYAYSIAKRRIAEFYRWKYKRLEIDTGCAFSLSVWIDPVNYCGDINKALHALSEIERLILIMQYFADMEIAEIAEILNYRIKRVRRIRKKSLPKLRVQLEKFGYGRY